MENRKNNNQSDADQRGASRHEKNSSAPNDLPDSQGDRERMEPEETYIDLPDVKDIPGQEFVNAPPAGMLSDTTISSDDEEGRNIFEDDDEADLRSGNEADVNSQERATLEKIDYMSTTDEDKLERAAMDNTDFENVPLNESSFGSERSGKDLDIPGSELDDRAENSGAEDEENNDYSLGSADNDNVNEGTP